jgi:arylsulfatase A-like enzyme
MKNVKQMCLGVAVAGIVAGAGSAVSTAVASAEPAAPDTTRSADTSDAGSSARAGSRTEARDRSARSRTATSPVGAAATAVETTNNDRPRASVQQRAPRTATTAIRSPRTIRVATESVTAPSGAADITAPEGFAPPQPVEQVAAAAVDAAPVAFAAVPALPAPAPVPLLPLLPLPALPVAPASAVTVSSASSTTTRRGANAVAAVQVTEPTHVLLIGVDGVNMSKILEYAYDDPTSGFRIIMDEGVTGTTSLVGHTTLSGPSWSTILTGAWDDKTGVFNNIFNPVPYDSWPTAFNLIEYYKPEVQTAVVADWQYINDIAAAGGYPADTSIFISSELTWEANDDVVAQRTIDLINETAVSDSAFIFSYQVAVDEAGHAAGGDSPEYEAAVLNTSDNIADIMAAIAAWEAANPGQEWTVITTTDHGHQPQLGLGHGFQSPPETSTFVIFDIEGDDTNDGKQNLAYSNADITPTIVNLFGIPQRSDFDGVPLQTRTSGIVTPNDLKLSVSDALGLYGYPDIAKDVALSVRTVFGAIPYFLSGFVESIAGFLQVVAGQEIFLISTLAQVAEFAVDFIGGALVGVTQAIAGVVARLTGSGVIAPTDPPLPPADSVAVPVLLPTAVLV